MIRKIVYLHLARKARQVPEMAVVLLQTPVLQTAG